MPIETVEMEEAWPTLPIKLRGRQQEWVDKIEKDLIQYFRVLMVAPGGIGKSTCMAALAFNAWTKFGIRTLVLENRDRLTEQTANRMRIETGLDVGVEKSDQSISPYDPIGVACVQSLSKPNRLTGFSDSHFGLLLVDECHLCLSPSWLRIIRWFHWGSASLAEDWIQPKEGDYIPKSRVVGFTASPQISGDRNLGELFQHVSVNYSYLDAITEGWLVGLKEINVPVKIDCRKFRRTKSAEGATFNVEDQNAAMLPIVKELAEQIPIYAPNKKGICFVPSLEIAKAMSAAMCALGLRAQFVSGECDDKNDKTDAFVEEGPGAWLVNVGLYNYGIDFPDLQAVAIYAAMISKVRYIQSVYRVTRVLPNLLKEWMTQEERLAAIASSYKDCGLLISPFFISDRIPICEPFDLFGTRPRGPKTKKPPTDFTEPRKVRDYIAALEKAADPHRNKQARTIDPVVWAFNTGDKVLAHYEPQTAQDSAPPSREELDFLLAAGLDTTQIRSSGQAQLSIAKHREREFRGLATPKQLTFLKSLTRFDEATQTRVPMFKEEALYTMKATQAGAIMGRQQAKWRARDSAHA